MESLAHRGINHPKRKRRRPLSVVTWAQLAIILIFCATWQFGAGHLWLMAFTSRPTDIVIRVVKVIGSGVLWIHLLETVKEVVYGYAIGGVLGLSLGLVMGRLRTVARILEPFVLMIYSIPKIAIAPLFILWLGIGLESKLVMVVLSVFFLVFYNSYSGIRSVSEEQINLARLMGASRFDLVTRVIVPAALPSVMLGLKMSIPYAFIGAIVGEFIASNRGIGYKILESSSQFDTAGMFAYLIILMSLVFLADMIFLTIEKRLMKWKKVEEVRVAL